MRSSLALNDPNVPRTIDVVSEAVPRITRAKKRKKKFKTINEPRKQSDWRFIDMAVYCSICAQLANALITAMTSRGKREQKGFSLV